MTSKPLDLDFDAAGEDAVLTKATGDRQQRDGVAPILSRRRPSPTLAFSAAKSISMYMRPGGEEIETRSG